MIRHQFVVFATILSLAGITYAAPITFTGLFSGANENPGTGSPGTGSTTVIFDPATGLLTVNVTFSGLEAGTTASHIHCCIAPPGNASVATTVPTFPGFPLGVTSGSYLDTLDLTQASSFNPAFITANGGTVATAESTLAAGLLSGTAYLNIHTTLFPGGEVRAFLQPVPEPMSAMLVVTGLAGFWAMRRKRGNR